MLVDNAVQHQRQREQGQQGGELTFHRPAKVQAAVNCPANGAAQRIDRQQQSGKRRHGGRRGIGRVADFKQAAGGGQAEYDYEQQDQVGVGERNQQKAFARRFLLPVLERGRFEEGQDRQYQHGPGEQDRRARIGHGENDADQRRAQG